MTPPSAKSWEQLDIYNKQILGVKVMEMDSGVSHLTIVHTQMFDPPPWENFPSVGGFLFGRLS